MADDFGRGRARGRGRGTPAEPRPLGGGPLEPQVFFSNKTWLLIFVNDDISETLLRNVVHAQNFIKKITNFHALKFFVAFFYCVGYPSGWACAIFASSATIANGTCAYSFSDDKRFIGYGQHQWRRSWWYVSTPLLNSFWCTINAFF